MNLIILIYVAAFCIFNYAIAIFLKKRYHISYDPKTLLSSLLFLIVSVCIYFIGDLDPKIDKTISLSDKVYWMIIVSVGSYAVIQFIIWLFYSFLIHNKFTRLPRFTFNIFASVFVIVFLTLFAKYLFDIDLAGFLVTSTVISAVVGLSVQDTLTNLFAGVSLQSEAPFTIGEWVYVGGQEGKVVNQNWRSLTLLSRESHRITLPNKLVAQEKIINYSRPTERQIHVFDVGLDYSHPPNEVKMILNQVLTDMPEVKIDDEASPFIKEYADSGIIYSMKFWIEDFGLVPKVQDKVLARLWYALNRKNIKIPYPISELHVQMMDNESTDENHVYNKEKVQKELKALSWLKNISEEHFSMLAEKSWLESYALDENLIVEGHDGDSMFIIISGRVNVLIKNPEEIDVKIATKAKGEYFGEMSLLTGKPRTATIRAAVDTTVIVIDKKAFTEILMKDSKLLDIFITSLESNQSALTKMMDEFAKQSDIKEPGRVILMRRIRSYLNITND